MSVCPHVNTFLYVFHHVKSCTMSWAMTDYMQLTELCQAPELQLELVFDVVLKFTDISSCFRPAQPHVSTLSPLSQSVCQIMKPEPWSVSAQVHIPSWSWWDDNEKSLKREKVQQHSKPDLPALGKGAADGVGGTGGKTKTVRCHWCNGRVYDIYSSQQRGCDNLEIEKNSQSFERGLKPEWLFRQLELLPLIQSLVTLAHNSNLVVITH